MIRSFADEATKDIGNGENTPAARRFPAAIWGAARRKLDYLHAAGRLQDLSAPPGNRLEKLQGRWREFYSIRVNDQYRIVFKWTGGGAEQVEIIDYH